MDGFYSCVALVSYNDAMQTAKDEVRKLLERIPDEATFEEIQYHIYVREKIAHGLADAEAGRVISSVEAERRMAKWLGK